MTPAVPGLGVRVAASNAVRGAVVLATCNRVEVYVDSDGTASEVTAIVRRAMNEALDAPTTIPMTVRADADALEHLFRVGAGLDSMVMGDRQIAGQLRSALRSALDTGTATGLLTDAVEHALRTAHKVSAQTRFGSTGRSVVSVSLDLLRREWPSSRVLLLGTGSYAGAVVADLRRRGCTDIRVHSSSHRAPAFAASHPGVAAVTAPLDAALLDADVVVSCRGTGTILTAGDVATAMTRRGGRDIVFVDLAITRDIDPAARALDGVLLIDLSTIAHHVPDVARREVHNAHDLVAEGVQDLVTRLKGREMNPAVIALRDVVNDMLSDEIDRLPHGRPVTREEAAHALRRLAARLVHVPSVRARKAAEEGRHSEYLAALSELWGLEPQVRPVLQNLELSREAAPAIVSPDSIESDACPATGLSLYDLGDRPRREAI